MATKTIARPRTPVASEDNAQGPADRLENTLSQLEALLWVCHGEDIDWCSGEVDLDNWTTCSGLRPNWRARLGSCFS
jgi:hypothetical protein